MPREMKSFCACAAVLTMCLLPSAHAAGASAQMPPTPAVQTPVPAAGSAAPQDSGAGQMMPVDVQTSPDGTELKKIYDVDAKTSPDQIPQDDFERGGMQYTFQDLLRIEMPDIDRRVHSETVTVSSSSNNSKDVLSLLPESKQVTTADGYAGTAYLDISSISTKVAGTAQVSHDLSAIREYPDLSEMDMDSIPKTITENGNTLRFASVDWKTANEETDNFGTIEPSYTAVVKYTGTATSSRTTGYTITAVYAGEVTHRNNDRVRYIAVYSGAPAVPADAPVLQEDLMPPDMTGLIDEPQAGIPASWVLCAVFGVLMLLFALRPPMCRKMMRQMQYACGKAKEGVQRFQYERERIVNEKKAKRAEEDAREHERQQVFGPLEKLKAAMRNRRRKRAERNAVRALAAPQDQDNEPDLFDDEISEDDGIDEIGVMPDPSEPEVVPADSSVQRYDADDDDEYPGISGESEL